MTLPSVVTASGRFDVSGGGFEPRGEFLLGNEEIDPCAHLALSP